MRRAILACLVLAACSDEQPTLTVEELQDPETCKSCHPKHYEEWSASMHSYASDDPIFVALNNRGQADTNNSLGDFCVRCHAPMAVTLGTTNGLNFDPATLPKSQRGVTCYFCHNVTGTGEPHNNSLTLAMDTTMRGGVKNPVDNTAHKSQYLTAMDGNVNDSSMCGSCHDIVLPNNIHLERTFAEWRGTVFATSENPGARLSCGGCHTNSVDGVIADDPDANVPFRRAGFHEHTMSAIDEAIIDWPGKELNKQRLQRDLDAAVDILGVKEANGNRLGGICLTADSFLRVRLDGINIGHNFPSGATQDRRVWLEVIAYDASDNVVFSSGVVPDGMDPEDLGDSQLFGLWDRTFKDVAKTQPSHFFWDVEAIESNLLLPTITLDPTDPAFDHSRTAEYFVPGIAASIERVEARLLFRPLPYVMLDDLIASGHLDARFRMIPTLTSKGATSTWRRSTAAPVNGCNPWP